MAQQQTPRKFGCGPAALLSFGRSAFNVLHRLARRRLDSPKGSEPYLLSRTDVSDRMTGYYSPDPVVRLIRLNIAKVFTQIITGCIKRYVHLEEKKKEKNSTRRHHSHYANRRGECRKSIWVARWAVGDSCYNVLIGGRTRISDGTEEIGKKPFA